MHMLNYILSQIKIQFELVQINFQNIKLLEVIIHKFLGESSEFKSFLNLFNVLITRNQSISNLT